MKYRKFNDEVLYTEEVIPRLDKSGLEFLKRAALKNSRKRIRLCTHRDMNDRVHEMFIIHTRHTYIRPHKHLGKPESLFVIDGKADIIFFNQTGEVTDKISMGPVASGKNFYYRIDGQVFHTLIVRSVTFCFKEVTAGPFRREDMVFAPWSPEEMDTAEVSRFLKDLEKKVSKG